MKSYKELEDQYQKVSNQLDELFGCSYGSELVSLLESLIEFASWTNGIVEDAKNSGVYDAVMHERDKKELESSKLMIKRLNNLSSIGIALDYMKSIYKIEFSDELSLYGEQTRRQADNQLRDQVKYFLNTFTKEGTDEHL